MDCKTATLVYQSDNPLDTIQRLFPIAWAFLEEQTIAFIHNQPDRFDTAVKQQLNDTPFQFRVVHRDDNEQLTQDLAELLGDITSRLLLEQHFSQVVDRPIFFSTVCCSGHITADHNLTLSEVLPIQKAAVQLQ